MGKIAKFKGTFYILDSTGRTQEITKAIEQQVTVNELTYVIQEIDANQVDEEIQFAGVERAKAIYINPGDVSVAVEVKFESDTNVPHKIDKPSVLFGEFTRMFVSTGVEAITFEAVIAGV